MRSVPVDTSKSPFAKLEAVGIDSIHLRDCFWQPRREINSRTTIPSQRLFLGETFRLRNFDHASGATDEPHVGQRYNDSDVYKWLEAASWSLVDSPDHALRLDIEHIATRISAAQDDDGYINTYFSGSRRGERFTDLPEGHEIYCIGHLIQAAIALKRSCGSSSLLQTAIKAAQCLADRFGDKPDQTPGTCGHPVAEMALVELSRTTGNDRWLGLARHMLQARGRIPAIAGGKTYTQDHAPITEQDSPAGHAVRQLYLAAGVADYEMETGDSDLSRVNQELWNHFVGRCMLPTGGAGSRWDWEAFGEDWELPSDRSYAESCAAIAAVQWHHRRWLASGDPRIVDLMEWTLINAVLPGISLSGDRYFYQNPLADRGGHRRRPWFGCACCPPNLARILAMLPGLFVARTPDTLQIGIFADMEVETEDIHLEITTNYPWDGVVRLRGQGSLTQVQLRIPEWASGATRDGKRLGAGWCTIDLSGGKIDTTIILPLWIRRFRAHPHVHACRGQAGLHRGPIIYCAESTDNPMVDPYALSMGDAPNWTVRPCEIDGFHLRSLHGNMEELTAPEGFPWRNDDPVVRGSLDAMLVPYFAWANRSAGPMSVWFHDRKR